MFKSYTTNIPCKLMTLIYIDINGSDRVETNLLLKVEEQSDCWFPNLLLDIMVF